MVPKCAAVDSRAAADYLRQPGASEASFPFAKGPARGTIPPASGSGTSSKKRGKQPAHSDAQAKYAGGRVPKEIKRLLKNSWPLLECMKKGKIIRSSVLSRPSKIHMGKIHGGSQIVQKILP